MQTDSGPDAAPAVTAASISSSPVTGDTYGAGELIEVEIGFGVAITVTGEPQLALTIGSESRQAGLSSSDTTSLTFRYLVQSSDEDADGISIAASALTSNGGTIQNSGGVDATLGLGSHAITDSTSHKVDGGSATIPAVTSASITSNPADGEAYGAGETLAVVVGFGVPVQVTGSPQLELGVGEATAQADYARGSGTTVLTFEYAARAGDLDADGVSVAAGALRLNGGSIASRVGTAAELDLGAAAITDASGHAVDGGEAPPTVTSVTVTSSPVSGDRYGAGEPIEVEIGFGAAITVTGEPQLALTIGSESRQAGLSSSDATSLTFRYTVQSSDEDSDGISIAASALSLNGGTIQGGGDVDVTLGLGSHAITDSTSHKVDGGSASAPAVTSVSITSSPADGETYGVGETLAVAVEFGVPVDVTGSPQLDLGIGESTAQADYVRGSGTAELTFEYAARAGDLDADGVSVAAGALGLNGGAIASRVGTAAELDLGAAAITDASGHAVDGGAAPPAVTSVAVISSPVSGDTYGAGERIEAEIDFGVAITVTGEPQLALTIGSESRQAGLSSSDATTLTFRYTVQSSDEDGDGISIAASALTLNGGTIQDGEGVDATLGLDSHAITDSTSHKVDGGSATAPAVTTVSITSNPADGETYGAGETLAVEVEFGIPVEVTGSPQLALGIGESTAQADYVRGSGTVALTFEYAARPGDLDADGVSVGAGALGLNGGAIASRVGTAAELDLGAAAIANASGHGVDGGAAGPAVTSVSVTSGPVSGDAYGAGERIEVEIGFGVAITVTGEPQLALDIGSATVQAAYSEGGTSTAKFAYLVQSSDEDGDGISIGASALALNGGTIQDGAGIDATLGLGSHAITDSSGHKVDGGSATTPAVTSVSITSSPADGQTYGAGETLAVEVEFGIPVQVTGSPKLALGIGESTARADYVRGSGTVALTFEYAARAGDLDADGVSVGAGALGLNGGAIASRVGTAAELDLGAAAIANASGHGVDGGAAAPAVTSVAVTSRPVSGDTYGAGERIEVEIGFGVAITVTGEPQLALGIGSATVQAAYSESGASTAKFAYLVQSSDEDGDGISIGASALALNGGTIQDGGGVDATLGLGSHVITDSTGHKVDGGRATTPAVTSVSITSNPADGEAYGAGETLAVVVEFGIPVQVTGSPQLELGIGESTAQADYVRGSGTAALTFEYAARAGDLDADGVSVGAGALGLNGGAIASRVGTAAELDLGAAAITNASGHGVNGGTAAPAVTSVSVTSSPVSGETYGAGERIEVEIGFGVAITVTGEPQLALNIGSATVQAAYSGSGTSTAKFAYLVQSSDEDGDGISIGASALTLNGGTIQDGGGVDATLGLGSHAITDSSGHKVDGGSATIPTISSVSITSTPADGEAYGAGETLAVVVEFGIPVQVTGSPQLELGIGESTAQADYVRGSGTAALTFEYAARAGDLDADGVSVGAGALGLNGGAIASRVGTAAELDLAAAAIANASGHGVDGGAAAPAVTSVAVTSSPVSGDTYGAGERIEVEIGFGVAITVTGEPQLALGIGSATVQAAYSESGTSTAKFAYLVQSSDEDGDGISIAASALTLNGGTIQDGGGVNATLGLGSHAITDSTSHKVDGGRATIPTISSVSITSTPASGDTYGASESITVEIGFSVPVTVTGSPQAALTIGASATHAAYVSGSTTGNLTFSYSIQSSDWDSDGIDVSSVELNGGTIQSNVGTSADLDLGALSISNAASHKVNGGAAAPAVSSVSVTSSPVSGDTYGAGERIDVEIGFDVATTVTGEPQLALQIGSTTVQAAYSGSGTSTAKFAYLVQSSDEDGDGISIGASALALNGGTIQDRAGIDATLGLGGHAITDSTGHKVDGGSATTPTISSASITSAPASGDTYGASESITVQIGFSTPVTVTGSPQAALTIGASTKYAAYASGSTTKDLTFSYSIQSSDWDSDGIDVSSVGLNGGTIQSDVGTSADLGLGALSISSAAGHKVNGGAAAPSVSSVSVTSSPVTGDSYGAGERIDVEIGFDVAITVTGEPQLALQIGSATVQAGYSGSGTSTAKFAYLVQASDEDADGISIGASALALNGGTLQSQAGVAALLDLGNFVVTNASSHNVDGRFANSPAVNSVEITSSPATGDTYAAGESVEVRVGFNIPISVTGSPQVALTVDKGTVHATLSGSDSDSLTFAYLVRTADLDSDGISIAADGLALNGGVIESNAGVPAVLGIGTHAISNAAGHKLAGLGEGQAQAPTIDSVTVTSTATSSSTYGAGEAITAKVSFNAAVTVTGSPQLALTIGSQTRQASLTGSDSTSLTFRYIVQSADTDVDGISMGATALTLNGGTIQGGEGTAASLGLGDYTVADSASHKVDGSNATIPTVSSVSITSTPASGDTYGAAESITVQIGFSVPVTVTGSPQAALTIGTSTKYADYASGNATKDLTFSYAVQPSDSDSDGIDVPSVGLNGGTIQSDVGTSANLSIGTLSVSSAAGHKVNGGAPAPSVNSVSVTSSPVYGDAYGAGERIEVEIGFDIAVSVTGSPQLALNIGTATVQAAYSGSGTSSAKFAYVVQSSDQDADGISIGASALALNGGALQSQAGTAALLGLGNNAVTNANAHKVDGRFANSPAVNSLEITSSPETGDTYAAGESVEVRVGFNMPVSVTGSPQVALTIDNGTVQATLTGSQADSLTFAYLVAAADLDADGISVAAGALALNGGVIQSHAGVPAALGIGTYAISNAAGHKLAGLRAGQTQAPAVNAVTITSTPISGSTYGAGEVITVTVGFSAGVTTTGSPQLALTIGSATRKASLAGFYYYRTPLTFSYTVQSTDTDADGITIGADALTLNGGRIYGWSSSSRTTVDATLGLGSHAIANSSSHKVTGSSATTPTVSSASITSTPASATTYGSGERIEVTVGFNIPLSVTGSPRLGLTIGAGTKQATLLSKTSQSLRFGYIVQTSDADTNGIAVGASALSLNGGTIASLVGTAATLGLGTHAISDSSSHKVAGSSATAPTVSDVRFTSYPQFTGETATAETPNSRIPPFTYIYGEEICARVEFNLPINVTGSPQLAITFDSGDALMTMDSWDSEGLNFCLVYSADSLHFDQNGLSIGANALTLNSGTINSQTGTNATLSLGSHAITNDSSHKAGAGAYPGDEDLVSAPLDAYISIISSPSSGDTYGAGEEIIVEAWFAIPISVTSSFRQSGSLQIQVGSSVSARIKDVSKRAVTFGYIVRQSDRESSGVSVNSTSLGDITAQGGSELAIAMIPALSAQSGHKVDGSMITAPAVNAVTISSSPKTGDTYGAGATIQVKVGFSSSIAVTGSPRLALGIGSATAQASYSSHDSNSITFRYVVQSADSDTNGLSIGASALALNGGTIKSSIGGASAPAADLGLGSHAISNSSSHKVSGSTVEAPDVTSSQITSAPVSTSTYRAGERIEIRVTFSPTISVTGSPQLALTVGSNTRQAALISSDANGITFGYVVVSGDRDTDGISYGASALTLNGGTIQNSFGPTAALLSLGSHVVSNSASHKVDGRTSTTPTVTSVEITSSAASDSTYKLGETIEVEVDFNIPVTVTGTPQLGLTVGSSTRQASYASGTSTKTLTFSYPVTLWDVDTDGISIAANALRLNSGTIQSGSGTSATLSLSGHTISNNAQHKVNGPATVPAVNSVAITSSPLTGDTYNAGEPIEVSVGFDIPLSVTGSPQLALTIGAATVQASLLESSAMGLKFQYIVQSANTDADGISIGASALTLNGGTLQSSAGTNAALGLGTHEITNSPSHKVDGSSDITPAVGSVTITSSPASGDTYDAGETITVQLGFQIPVTVTGSPQLALVIGTSTVQATYASGSGTKNLTFNYELGVADRDSDGVSIAAGALALNSGTLRSGTGTNATLGLGANAITNSANHKVDGPATPPRVTGVTITSIPSLGRGSFSTYLVLGPIHVSD